MLYYIRQTSAREAIKLKLWYQTCACAYFHVCVRDAIFSAQSPLWSIVSLVEWARECYDEWWESSKCEGDRSFHSVFKYDVSPCISATDVYGAVAELHYSTPTSRCSDAACTDCVDFVYRASSMYECTPCSFSENCSFMWAECQDDGNLHPMPLRA